MTPDTITPPEPLDLEPIVRRLAHQNRMHRDWHLAPDSVVARTQQRDITRLLAEVRRLRLTVDDLEYTVDALSEQLREYH